MRQVWGKPYLSYSIKNSVLYKETTTKRPLCLIYIWYSIKLMDGLKDKYFNNHSAKQNIVHESLLYRAYHFIVILFIMN